MFLALRKAIAKWRNNVNIIYAYRWWDFSARKWYVEVKYYVKYGLKFVPMNAQEFTEFSDVDGGIAVFGGTNLPEPLFGKLVVSAVKIGVPTNNMLKARTIFREREQHWHRCSICGADGVTEINATTFELNDGACDMSIGGSNFSCANPEHLEQVRSTTKGITVTKRPVRVEMW